MINKKTVLIILSVAVVLGIFIFWMYAGNMLSQETLRLEILGPDKAQMGQEIEYTVRYKNNGNFLLQNAKLIFDLPDNSLTEDSKTRLTKDLNDIYPGDEEVVKFKARLLGKEGDVKTARASLSYTPKNLTVPYESDTSFTTKIDTVPMTLDFDLPTKAEAGKNLQYSINYFSNIDYPMENLSLKINLVDGFEFKSSDPSSIEGSEWRLETLNKAQGGRITIRGAVTSNTDKNLTFSAQLGMWQNGNFVVIKDAIKDVRVIQPLLFISQQVNGVASYVASPGETLKYQIFFRNIGSTPFDNLFMVVKMDGQALDMSSIQTQGAQVQLDDNMIVWDYRQVPQLSRLDPQEEGEVVFYVKVKDDWNPTGSDENGATITNEVNISQITQKFTIKVNSGLVISQSAYYKSSDIENSGPTPPKVGEATTYTVTWNVSNYLSDTKNVRVRAVLPENVSLTGKIMPPNESSNFSFDSASREIVWAAGDILAGTGVKGDPYTISFQLSLTPSSSQKGSIAPLIGVAQISGENQFTNTIITAQDSAINTNLPDDFSNSGGGVVQ
ncbi:MAG: hypothetical protein Q8Q48_01925 [Candidatus Staskawiczbacteria bacterium]|nr:hypothetical protein [Candidatus Staskawiczbacteria bacterium]